MPISPAPASSSNLESPIGSLPDLEGVGGHLTSTQSQFEVHFAALASIPMPVQGFSRFENSIVSRTQLVASFINKISNIEQSVDGLAARVAALEAGAASVSSSSGSARSWNVLEHSDGSPATRTLGS